MIDKDKYAKAKIGLSVDELIRELARLTHENQMLEEELNTMDIWVRDLACCGNCDHNACGSCINYNKWCYQDNKPEIQQEIQKSQKRRLQNCIK